MDRNKSKARGEPKKGKRSSSADKVELQQYPEAPKARDFADHSYRSSGLDMPTIIEPKKHIARKSSSRSRECSNVGGRSRNQSCGDSVRSSTRSSQSLQPQTRSDTARSGSPIADFMADSIMSYLPRRKNSVPSTKGFDEFSGKKPSKSVPQKLKGLLGPTKDEVGQKCLWDLFLVQDRLGKHPVSKLPERWIRLSLPGSGDSTNEYVSWPGSQVYTLDEKIDWPFPMAAYLYGSIPPRPRAWGQFMLIFRITSYNDNRTEGQAERFFNTVRFMEGKLSLRVKVEFDEEKDHELSKSEHQIAIKEMLERVVRRATSTAPKKAL